MLYLSVILLYLFYAAVNILIYLIALGKIRVKKKIEKSPFDSSKGLRLNLDEFAASRGECSRRDSREVVSALLILQARFVPGL